MTTLLEKRRALRATTTLAVATTLEITNLLRDRPLQEIASQLRTTMPEVTRQFGQVAAIVSAQQYNDARTAARLQTQYQAQPRVANTNFAVQSAVGFAIGQLDKGLPYQTFQSTLTGSVQRLTMSSDRETVKFNVGADRDSVSYERIPSAGSCSFCLTMAAVVRFQRSAEFDGYHNSCRCTLNPVFRGQSRTELPIYDEVREAYDEAASQIERKREEVGWYSMKTREAASKYPELTQTTKNRLKIVRQLTGWK
jgi:hypothetical protein